MCSDQRAARNACRRMSWRTGKPTPPRITATIIGPRTKRSRREARQAVGIGGEAGIAEGGDRKEHAVPSRLRPGLPVSVAQSERQHRSRHQFDADRDTQDQPQHADDVAEPQAAGFRLRDQAGAEPQPPSDQEPEQGRPAHDPETAYLEQGEDDSLPEAGPVGGRVRTISPVTHTAEVAVKSAVRKGAAPSPARAAGSISKPVPSAMARRKVNGTSRAGCWSVAWQRNPLRRLWCGQERPYSVSLPNSRRRAGPIRAAARVRRAS